MADQDKDVIRLQAPTEAEITGGSPPAVKLQQQIHALDTGNFFYKNSLGQLVKFLAAANLASQAGDGRGSVLIGDSGVTGVTPLGGTLSGPGTLHAMLVGLKNYADAIASSVALAQLFTPWDEEESYSQNEIVVWTGDGLNYLAISNVPGDDTNTGHNPQDADPAYWTNYTDASPLGQVITMILNTKANA